MQNHRRSYRTLLSLSFSLLLPAASLLAADPISQSAVATVDQLKTQALEALKGGKFDQTSQLLNQAASISHDPNLTQMTEWLSKFNTQRQQLAADRAKLRDKAVKDVHTLLEHDTASDYAYDKLRDACILAEDKDKFRAEPWVQELITKEQARADEEQSHEQWLRARQLYADMSAMDPTNPKYKEEFKAVTNRLRILQTYAPDDLKKAADEEYKKREQADQIINPTTQPSTKPEVADNESFKIDWHDMLHGIQMSMLLNALDDARENYWRDVSYKKLIDGGLRSLTQMANMHGLDKTFSGLADNEKQQAFLAALDEATKLMNNAAANDEEKVAHRILTALVEVNKRSIDLPEEVLVNEFSEGAFAELDPFSTMIWPGDLEEFNRATQGEFSGVGIQIQSDPDDGSLKVVSPVEDTPAYRMHIQAGDIITRINGKDAKGISINQAVKNITGPQGSYVILTIKSPDGKVKDYNIKRETIKVASVKGFEREPGGAWDYFVDPDSKIAYVRITSFTKTTEDDLNHALADLQHSGAKALIIDLRANPGGLLTAATEVCDRFLTDGTIVSTKGERDFPQQPPIKAHASNDDVKLPVVVLINQASASASEIVSGALQDDHRALIVGERSFGKGSVQMMFPLADRTAALKLTTSHYYLPSGRCIHKEDNSTQWGVDPDVNVEMTIEQIRSSQEAQQSLEVLRDKDDSPATAPTTVPSQKLLSVDSQLATAVLLLKLQLAGATL